MALFGRDSLITSYQALPYLPELAATTLRVARRAPGADARRLPRAGARQDPARAALRGADGPRRAAALAVLRVGGRDAAVPRAARRVPPLVGRRPSSSASSSPTPAPRWRGSRTSGDLDGDGYVEYARRNPRTGLVNQCWKDSWDAIQFADGTLASGPIATCEIQGYVYDAQRRAARLAREVWGDPALAERLERRAADLRERFRRDFWMPERGCHALALDGDKRQVDSLTSNIGHLLWSGLLDERRRRPRPPSGCSSEELWSGWGVRTLGAARGRLQPARLPHRHRLAPRELADRRRPRALRPRARRRRRSPPRSSARRRTSSIACPRSSAAMPRRPRRSRSRSPPPRVPRHGPREPRCCC